MRIERVESSLSVLDEGWSTRDTLPGQVVRKREKVDKRGGRGLKSGIRVTVVGYTDRQSLRHYSG